MLSWHKISVDLRIIRARITSGYERSGITVWLHTRSKSHLWYHFRDEVTFQLSRSVNWLQLCVHVCSQKTSRKSREVDVVTFDSLLAMVSRDHGKVGRKSLCWRMQAYTGIVEQGYSVVMTLWQNGKRIKCINKMRQRHIGLWKYMLYMKSWNQDWMLVRSFAVLDFCQFEQIRSNLKMYHPLPSLFWPDIQDRSLRNHAWSNTLYFVRKNVPTQFKRYCKVNCKIWKIGVPDRELIWTSLELSSAVGLDSNIDMIAKSASHCIQKIRQIRRCPFATKHDLLKVYHSCINDLLLYISTSLWCVRF